MCDTVEDCLIVKSMVVIPMLCGLSVLLYVRHCNGLSYHNEWDSDPSIV